MHRSVLPRGTTGRSGVEYLLFFLLRRKQKSGLILQVDAGAGLPQQVIFI